MKVDLASRALGGSVVAASDESFGVKERLIEPTEPSFVPGTFDLRGEVVDGWETRRHADGDWAIVRLGVGGRCARSMSTPASSQPISRPAAASMRASSTLSPTRPPLRCRGRRSSTPLR
jgi:allantoicase